jgi:hypothetical protein
MTKNLVLAVPNAVIFNVLLFIGDDHWKKGKNTCFGQCRLSNRQSNGNGLVGFLLKNGDLKVVGVVVYHLI